MDTQGFSPPDGASEKLVKLLLGAWGSQTCPSISFVRYSGTRFPNSDPGSEPLLHSLVFMSPWASHLTSPDFSFHICTVGIVAKSSVCGKDEE